MTKVKKFLALNAWRDEVERAAEREYRDALIDYNEGLRVAYKKYHDKLDVIEKEWQKRLQEIPE